MPSSLRFEFAGAMCHLLSRGDHREATFRDDEERRTFLCNSGRNLREDRVFLTRQLIASRRLTMERPGIDGDRGRPHADGDNG